MIPTLLADGWHMHDGGWGGMWIATVVFLAVVLGLAAWAIRGGLLQARPHPPESPLERLDRSLAEGTISPQDYRERRALLTREQASPDAGGGGQSGA